MPKQRESSEGERRRRTYWVVRRRYKQVRWLAAGLGMLLAILLVRSAAVTLGAGNLALDEGFGLTAVLLLLVGLIAPWLLVEGLWRLAKRRNYWNWQ